jgi:hypothetical protein
LSKNNYIDLTGFEEHEKGVPLLAMSVGYSFNVSVIRFVLQADADFFGMDLVRGNRDFIILAKPHTAIGIPLRVHKVSLIPLAGYGGIYKRRFIKERTYLSGEDRYVNSADYENETMGFLWGEMFCYNDWFMQSFVTSRDFSSYYSISLKIRTPVSEKNAPYITLLYTGGEEVETFGFGLTFYR